MNSKNLSRIITILVLVIVIIAIILLFQGNGDRAKLVLKGNTDMIIYQNDRFTDPGYEITETSSTNGFYVNIDGIVDNNKIGVYYLKYLLYNKNGVLVSEASRRVFVLENHNANITIYLNGEDEEYYFVDDYFDNGAVAYQNSNDISNSIMVDSSVKSSSVGTYDVKYQVTINGVTKEITRKVNIIDYDIEENIDYVNLNINLVVNCDNYYYTVLPNNSKNYSRNIDYGFNDVGKYDFEVYLKSGSHKKYTVDIISIDKTGPTGSCTLTHELGKTTINMNVTDPSGLGKFTYNGLDFYNSTKELNSIVANVTVRAYDKFDNYTDFKCKSEYGTGFRNVNVQKSGYISCGTVDKAASQELDTLMQAYGYKTRAAVAAAGTFLVTYKYNIPYFWGGKTITKGIDSTWGCRKKHTTGQPCTKPMASDNSYCQYGLDCAGFTRWAFIQAGFDNSILQGEKQTEHSWGKFNPNKHKYSFVPANISYANQIKPGDIVHKPGHVGLVIGVNAETIQVAEMRGPIIINIIKKTNGVSVNGQASFADFVLFDEFYKMYGNS